MPMGGQKSCRDVKGNSNPKMVRNLGIRVSHLLSSLDGKSQKGVKGIHGG